MKLRLWVSILLVCACILTACFCLLKLESVCGNLQEKLKTAVVSAEASNEAWRGATASAVEYWQKQANFLHICLPHMNLNELEWCLGALPDYYAQGDKKLYIEQCVRALQCLATIREMERVTWGNVF